MTLPDAVPPATFAPPANGVWDPKDHRAPYNAHAEAARPVNHLQEFIMTVNSHLAGVEFPHHIKEQREQGPLIKNNANKGDWQMLNSLLATLVIVLLGIFAAGSGELAEERTERRRVEKWLKKKYPRTY